MPWVMQRPVFEKAKPAITEASARPFLASRSSPLVKARSRYLEIMGTLGLPLSLEDLGLGEDDVEPMVDDFIKHQSRFIARNPRHPSRQELLALYRAMLEGY